MVLKAVPLFAKVAGAQKVRQYTVPAPTDRSKRRCQKNMVSYIRKILCSRVMDIITIVSHRIMHITITILITIRLSSNFLEEV